MQQTTPPSPSTTAIPARFTVPRERVLMILARWEATAPRLSMLSTAGSYPGYPAAGLVAPR